jgi:hypothetical protein
MRFVKWAVAFLVIAVGAALVAIIFVRGRGISSRRRPLPAEMRVARAGWLMLIPSSIRDAANPIPESPELLHEARLHWADHCAICHSNDGSGDTAVGRDVFPPAPDLRSRRMQQLTDGELFYAIEHGIPWTAMPAWSTGSVESERASWILVRFIRHLPQLTPAELQEMQRFNPRSAADLDRERAIEEFLKGGSPSIKGDGKGP